ncbi:galactoside 2-alpha-L-fucosyltransferase SEC1-like [Argopecten irradians]|uniref:galactoside 2-alpha-L-fucosyltransferase SEC1-like n=1 Tax=Argopecten irradians TaxID=31199 RepID=UPI003722A891
MCGDVNFQHFPGNTILTSLFVIGIFTVVNYLFPLTYRLRYRGLIKSVVYPSWDQEWANKLLLCPEMIGRLGNTMFEYAGAYGIAKEVNRTLVLPVDDKLWKYFHITAKAVYNRTFTCERWKHERIDFTGIWEKKIYDKVRKSLENVMLRHYFQSWKFFEKYKEEIKSEFSLKYPIQQSVNEILRHIVTSFYPLGSHVTFIGVHIRGGDYLSKRFASFGYSTAPIGYVKRAILYCLSKYPNPLFVVCSEDLAGTRNDLKSMTEANITVVYHETSPEIDFGLLVACNHTIMTVGSFGWWAGYLAGGDVIYYKYPIRENTKARKQFDNNFSDYFYPKWIAME